MILFLIVFIRTNENSICRLFAHMYIIDWCTCLYSPAKLLIHLWNQTLQEFFLGRGDSSCVGGNKGHIWRKLSELFKNSQKPAVDACDICRSHGVLNLRSGVQSLA